MNPELSYNFISRDSCFEVSNNCRFVTINIKNYSPKSHANHRCNIFILHSHNVTFCLYIFSGKFWKFLTQRLKNFHQLRDRKCCANLSVFICLFSFSWIKEKMCFYFSRLSKHNVKEIPLNSFYLSSNSQFTI